MTVKIENDPTGLCVSGTNEFGNLARYSSTSDLYGFPKKGNDMDRCSSKTGARVFVSTLLNNVALPLTSRNITEGILSGEGLCRYGDENCVDDDSSCTSYESSITLEPDHDKRKVQFASQLVSEIRERPRTSEEDVSSLYYSYEETQRFRQEYRLEKKLKAKCTDHSLTPDSPFVSQEDLSNLQLPFVDPSKRSRHHISRVVVEHKEYSKTFYYEDQSYSDKSEVVEIFHNQSKNIVGSSCRGNYFFDDDSFWSGSITWY